MESTCDSNTGYRLYQLVRINWYQSNTILAVALFIEITVHAHTVHRNYCSRDTVHRALFTSALFIEYFVGRWEQSSIIPIALDCLSPM